MTVTIGQAEKILKGNKSFAQLGFSMLLTRLKMIYSKDPSQTTLQNCTNEINAFLGKFGAIMTEDYAIISQLQ